jgi:hypothetical protein
MPIRAVVDQRAKNISPSIFRTNRVANWVRTPHPLCAPSPVSVSDLTVAKMHFGGMRPNDLFVVSRRSLHSNTTSLTSTPGLAAQLGTFKQYGPIAPYGELAVRHKTGVNPTKLGSV